MRRHFLKCLAAIRRSSRTGSRACRWCRCLHGRKPAKWRDYVVSEYDYSIQTPGIELGVAPKDSRLFMLADKRWKYIHCIGFRPMLFDMESDPTRACTISAPIRPTTNVRQRFDKALARLGFALSRSG